MPGGEDFQWGDIRGDDDDDHARKFDVGSEDGGE